MSWVDVGAIADLKFTPGAPVRIGDRWIAIFRLGGEWRAIDNQCPHASAPLCDGTVLDGKVVCYLHCWEFDLRTGACDVGPEWNVRTYPVRERDGRLEIQAPDGPPGPA
ncbi:MAG: nitrite reductase small subunit NirD [Planctomycetes bacterium]|nr:nitrite reductase small subunit NirD [Planctomycetota bacterium]